MYNIPALSYHNVDDFINPEGFYTCENLTRNDYKKFTWKNELDNLVEDLKMLISEYVDLENLELFIQIVDYIEEQISIPTSPFHQIKEFGLKETSIGTKIDEMIKNIEEGFQASDYRKLDTTTKIRVEDFIKQMESTIYVKGDISRLKILSENESKKNKIKK